jgi:hypothetical protein
MNKKAQEINIGSQKNKVLMTKWIELYLWEIQSLKYEFMEDKDYISNKKDNVFKSTNEERTLQKRKYCREDYIYRCCRN